MLSPKFSIFDFEDRGGHTRLILDLFEDIVEAEHDPKILTLLKHVRFDHTSWGGGRCHEDINQVKALLALPSLSSIEASDIDGNQHDGIGTPIPYRSSNIQSLSLARYRIRDRSMYEMLEATKQLRSFSLEDTNVDNYWLLASLLMSTIDSLEYLSLRPTWNYDDDKFTYRGLLKQFTTLQTVHIDKAMLENLKPREAVELEAPMPDSLRLLTIFLEGGMTGDLRDRFQELIDANVGTAVLPRAQSFVVSELHKVTTEQRDAIEDLSKAFKDIGIIFHAGEDENKDRDKDKGR